MSNKPLTWQSSGRAFIPSGSPIDMEVVGRALASAAGEVVSFRGFTNQTDRFPSDHTFTPDEAKGFLKFDIGYSLPVVNMWGQAFMPKVLAISYQSLLYTGLDNEHHVKAFNDQHWSDKFLGGAVLGVNFPTEPAGGWRIPKNPADAPRITAVASFSKLASGLQTIVGKHKTGKHAYQISYEAKYDYEDTYFAVALNGAKPQFDTPDDLVAAGYEAIPWTKASPELLRTFSIAKARMVGMYQGRKTIQLLGGLDKPVQFVGVGLVHMSAEGPSRIIQMAAGATDEHVREMLAPISRLSKLGLRK